ncbi:MULTISPECIES: alpha/beta fold hydrolase [Burkholderia]|uniref:alpha/beta fold hydrolase n=1 Tax=Burkholderia TaxID=32008 RepID=UPI00084124EE|nr:MULTISPECIES: alpha/beta hydrolase [unclassified Burkholderia]AOK32621.1 alpha/beta hydrolase [Burkholderia sp. Bp7605]
MDHGNIVHPQFVTLNNGVRLHYASAGQPGQPLMLFVHGFPEFWYAWQAQLSAFGDAYYAVAPDLRGFNLSSKPAGPGEYHPKLIVDDLAQLIDALGYSRAIVVAHDWGGAVCWSLAIKFPQLIDKLVIVNAPHPWLFANALANDPAQQAASAYMNWLRQPGSEDALAANDFANLEKFFTAGGQSGASWYTPEVRGKYHAAWSVPGDGGSHGLTGGLNYYRASPLHPPAGGEAAPDISKLVPEEWVVQVPTMVIWGESDTALPKTLLDGIERFVPDLRIERIPEGSHWVIHEQPERINTLIRGFVG